MGGILLTPGAYGYLRSVFTYGDGTIVAIKRGDAAGIQFYINSKIVAGYTSSASGAPVVVISSGSDPVYAIQAALATWNAVSGAAARFLPLKATDKIVDPSDRQMTIVVGSTADDLSILGGGAGALAITTNTAATFTAGTTASGDVTDSDVILNPGKKFSTDGSTPVDLQAVMTHELGHALGANHNGLWGATMFQFTAAIQRYLSPDDISFVTAVYPANGVQMGTVNGKVVAADGSPVQSGLVTLIDTAGGNVVGGLTGQDGTYSIQMPPASYILYVEPMVAGGLVQPGNLYLTAGTKVTTNFQSTVLGGAASPTLVVATAGNTTSAPNLTVTGGASSLTLPYLSIGGEGGTADVSSVLSGTPITISSGRALDIVMIGGGIDNTVTVQAYGKGISVRPGSIRVDPRTTFGGILTGMPLIRVTVDVAAQQSFSLASLFITKGQSTFVMSGAFPIVPPKPTFTSKSVVSAASYKGDASGNGVVSPGGISSIYDVVTNTLGPAVFAQPPGYDGYGKLATTLGGVTVTFDGVPAPLYLSYAGQLNFQVPFEIAGKTSTSVVINYLGSQSDAISVPVAPTQPAFFTFTPAGTDAIIQNFPDFSLNKVTNPVARGGIVLLFGTGIGKLAYPLTTGQPGTVPPSSYASTYSCAFGAKSSTAYAYWYYGFVGEAEWTVGIPADSETGAVTVRCSDSVTGNSTQPATIYIK